VISRLRMYWRYALRSLRRGGRRSLLAVFCIAVGVMAVVALRLAGDMIALSVTSNVRDVIGGDVSVQSTAVPLAQSDLAKLDELQHQGVITRYQALGIEQGTVRRVDGRIVRIAVDVIDDPAQFPLVGSGDFADPQGGKFADLLGKPGTVVLSDFVAGQAGARRGAAVHLNLVRGSGEDVTVTGVLNNKAFVGGFTTAYISKATYEQLSTRPARYGLINVLTADTDHAAQAATALRADFPQATVQTVQEALNENTTFSDQLDKFLTIVGLLALLIGGIGIVNTMQVSLSRRRVEIAMLKTSGYRRRDLYGMFAIEAGMLGLTGGVVGTIVGIGLSAVVRILVERVFFININFHVSLLTVLTGVLVGLVTSLIFALLPVVRAAAVRPQAVLRDLVRVATVGSAVQSIGLYLLLIALFTSLSVSLVGDVATTLYVVAGTIILLGLLTGVFALIVLVVGHLPVPERPRLGFLLLVTLVTLIAVRIVIAAPAIGAAFLLVALAGYFVVLLPRRVKTSLKLALRSLSRTKTRTATSLVALFVGVYTIGLILVLGQDISGKINDSLNTLSSFNVYALASAQDSNTVRSVTASLPGLQERSITDDVSVTPQTVDGAPIASRVQGIRGESAQNQAGGQFRLSALSGIEGYDLAANQAPDPDVNIGRLLAPGDAGTGNVLVRNDLRNELGFSVGTTFTVTAPTNTRPVTLHVVGFYLPVRRSGASLRFNTFFAPILGDRQIVDSIAGPDLQTVVSMKLDPSQKASALRQLEGAAPSVVIIDLADIAAFITQVLSNLVVLLVAIASLALFAGIVIIANTVALAMLERRREMGILKAVGHSSKSVLSQVLLENGIVGGIGAVAGMTAVTVATSVLGSRVLKTDLNVGTPIVVSVILGITAIVTITAWLVAWGPTKVRPLEVLRYE
jgi:putative ABC transport system permease protein